MPYDFSKDPSNSSPSTLDSPSRHVIALTPDDNTDLSTYVKALYIGVSGDVAVIPIQSNTETPVVFKNHPVGYLPCGVRRLMVTGTTATNIVGMGK